MNRTNKSYLFAGVAIFFWSTVATAFKLALREFDFIQLIFFASVVTLGLLFLFILIQKKTKLIFRQSKKDVVRSMFLGALNPLIYYLILLKAYSLLPAQMAQPLNMTWAILLAVLSVPLLGHKIGRVSFAALFVSFIGVIFISSQGSLSGFENTNWTGVLLALTSSVIWALYWIFHVRDQRDQIVKLFQNFFFGTIYLAVVVSLFSTFKFQVGTGFYSVIYIGFFEAGITYVLWLKAMELSTNNAKIGNLVFIAPFISFIFIHFILKETIYMTTFIGLIFIVAGIFIQQLDKK
jgi:drug/metabolite transporter (DMT)-like permease